MMQNQSCGQFPRTNHFQQGRPCAANPAVMAGEQRMQRQMMEQRQMQERQMMEHQMRERQMMEHQMRERQMRDRQMQERQMQERRPEPRQTEGCGCKPERLSREQLMKRITLSGFAMVDLNLYLDTHPEDREAIACFQENSRIYNDALAEYSKTYGPLTIAHAHHCDEYWKWVNEPWPWQ